MSHLQVIIRFTACCW